MIVTIIAWLCTAGAFTGTAYAIACAFAAVRFCNTTPPNIGDAPAVTLLKPLHRDEPQLRENLASFCRQNYPAPVQLVFGMNAGDSEACRAAEDVKAKHPAADIAIAPCAAWHGTNPKISNLVNMLPAAKHDLLVISDSDIAVPPDYLAIVTAAMQTPGTGAVTCCYTGAPAVCGLWPRLSAMGINQRFLPDVLFAIRHNLASPCFGSTIALTRQVLAEIGAFPAFAGILADDYEIGRAVRSKGYRIAVPPITVTHWCSEASAGALIRHELRWNRTIRGINPGGYAASIITHGLPMALAASLLTGLAPAAVAALVSAAASRMLLAQRINRLFGTRDPIWLVPVRDLLSFVIFISALFATRVEWRGARFRVTSAGALAQD